MDVEGNTLPKIDMEAHIEPCILEDSSLIRGIYGVVDVVGTLVRHQLLLGAPLHFHVNLEECNCEPRSLHDQIHGWVDEVQALAPGPGTGLMGVYR